MGVAAQELAAGDVTRVTVTVNGPGIAPAIEHDLVKTGTQWGGILGGIPVGTDRTFTGRAYNGSGTLLYEGEATGVIISRDTTALVALVLQQVTAPDPFTNSAPRITALVSSASQVEPGQTADLTVTAADPDGDPLTYVWTTTGGSLVPAGSAHATWEAPASEGAYQVIVSVTDGKGGQAGISMVLSVVMANGSARVSTSFNTWPLVSEVSATPGQMEPGQVAALDVTAMDVDGDALSYAWTDTCGGSFSSTAVKSPAWTAPATAPVGGDCTLTVVVNDGRGGCTRGSLLIHIGLPGVPNAPPVIDWSFQSADSVAMGGTVSLEVAAHDPEGRAVTFTWSASGGTLGLPATSASRSNVSWTAPVTGGSFIVTVVVRGAGGVQATQSFAVTACSLVDLGTLGGSSSDAVAVNNRGQVIGNSLTAGGAARAFLWTARDGMIDLGTLGGGYSRAFAVNSRGQVVGESDTAGGSIHAFSWTARDGMIDITPLALLSSYAGAVNDRGQVAGSEHRMSEYSRGFLWTAQDGLVELPIVGLPGISFGGLTNRGQLVGTTTVGPYSRSFSWTARDGVADPAEPFRALSGANAVNEQGQVVGLSYDPSGGTSRAFLWTARDGVVDLGPGVATAINERGQVVGRNDHAFSWTEQGGRVDLGTLGGASSSAVAVNEWGQVVGTSDTADGSTHAFLWTAHGGMVDLGTLGGRNSSAIAVNDRGQIAGTSDTADGNTHAVLWTCPGRH